MKQFNVRDNLLEMPKSYKKALFTLIEKNLDKSCTTQEKKKAYSSLKKEIRKKCYNEVINVSFTYQMFDLHYDDLNNFTFGVSIAFIDTKKSKNDICFELENSSYKKLARTIRYSIFDKRGAKQEDKQKAPNKNFSYYRTNSTLFDHDITDVGDGFVLMNSAYSIPHLNSGITYYVDISKIEDNMCLSFDEFFEFVLSDEYFLKVLNYDIQKYYGLNIIRNYFADLKKQNKTQQSVFINHFDRFSFLFAFCHFDKPFSFNEFHKQFIKLNVNQTKNLVKFYYPKGNKEVDYAKLFLNVNADYGLSPQFNECFDTFGEGKNVKFFPTYDCVRFCQEYLEWYYSIQFSKKYHKKYDIDIKKEINPLWVP